MKKGRGGEGRESGCGLFAWGGNIWGSVMNRAREQR